MHPFDLNLHESLGVNPSWSGTSPSDFHADAEIAGVEIVACAHTCLAHGFKSTDDEGVERALFNGGSAGMGNFKGDTAGVITRISTKDGGKGEDGGEVLYGCEVGGVRVEAVRVEFDDGDWQREFLDMWPEGSEAFESYWGRIQGGVESWDVGRAARGGVELR